MNNAQSSAQAM